MAVKKERKTDRRTVYTKMVIKDSLLELMKSRRFDKISVTAVCAQADITRATFYLHYYDLWNVVDELLAEALQISESMSSPREDARHVLSEFVMTAHQRNSGNMIHCCLCASVWQHCRSTGCCSSMMACRHT